jgi:predicted nucleic acid-binding protein
LRFWDSSAIVPLILSEATSRPLKQLVEPGGLMMVWWGTPVEVVSAVARRVREGVLDPNLITESRTRLAGLAEVWQEIEPSDQLRSLAERAVRLHALRAGDALQLAAASIASEGQHGSIEVITLDRRLRNAAERESFVVLPD